MIQKLFWIIILFGVVYTLGIFYVPQQADQLAKLAGIQWYNDFARSFKSTLDWVATDIPTKDEFVEGGKAALSGALDIKDTVVDGISTTKDTIDTVRSTLSGAESTYSDVKNTFDQAKDFVEGANEKVQKVQETLEDVGQLWESITDIVNTDAVNDIGEENNK